MLEILNSAYFIFISFTFVSIIKKLQELQQLDQQEKAPHPQQPCLEQQPLQSSTEQKPREVCSSSEWGF